MKRVTFNSLNCFWKIYSRYFAFIFCCITFLKCKDSSIIYPANHKFIEPEYDLLKINVTNDTLSFVLNEDTYNSVKSFNVFSSSNIEYVSFYDRRSQSINFYNFQTRAFIKKNLLKKYFPGKKLENITVYVINFDSILINNDRHLYLVDTFETIKKSIEFIEKPYISRASFGNETPVIWKDGKLYAKARCYLKETSIKELRKWKTLYSFNLQNGTRELHYQLPDIYRANIYGIKFLDYSYCYNEKGNFVFSFPADTLIYETNLLDYNISYFAKSKFQQSPIKPLTKKDMSTGEELLKSYSTRDSYGAIYFDSFRKRYLRIAKAKVNKEDYEQKQLKKKYSIIILGEDFKVIGESEVNNDLSLNTLFITHDGKIYVRTFLRDEYAIHFVRLNYSDNIGELNKISKNEESNKNYKPITF